MSKEDPTIVAGATVYVVNRVDGPHRLCRGVVDSIDCHAGRHAHVQWDSPTKCASYKSVTVLTTSPIVAISARNDLEPEVIGRIIEDAQERGLLPKA